MFSMPVGHCSNVRRCVVRGSLALAVAGWVGSLWSWADHGNAAGGQAGFVMALTVACTFSMTFTVAAVMPDQSRLYAIGFRDGATFAEGHHVAPEPTRLRSVR